MKTTARIFDIKRDCSEDGQGIRTTVFFKGCPLSCVWCQNPEGKHKHKQLSFREEACHPEACGGACVKVCESHCLRLLDKLHVDFDACTRCDKCFDVCPTNALEPVGYDISLDDLLYRVLIDKPIFQTTGGGVTLSGGEVTQQMEFASEFLQALKKENIHTAIETSGFFNYRKFKQQILPFLDVIYFDLKLINEDESRKYTGQTNQLIKTNFIKLISDTEIPIYPRIPLIPDITATEKNLSGIAEFLQSLHIPQATLLPYNPLWVDKLKRLNIKAKYINQHLMDDTEKQQSVNYFSRENTIPINKA